MTTARWQRPSLPTAVAVAQKLDFYLPHEPAGILPPNSITVLCPAASVKVRSVPQPSMDTKCGDRIGCADSRASEACVVAGNLALRISGRTRAFDLRSLSINAVHGFGLRPI
jgi:hypothetical protein